YLRLKVRGDREGEAHVHAGRVPLDRRLDKALDFREGDDLVELARDLGAAHAEDRTVQVDVLAPGQLRMKARADFKERADTAVELDAPVGRLRDARENFQERTLACAVMADDAEQFALL